MAPGRGGIPSPVPNTNQSAWVFQSYHKDVTKCRKTREQLRGHLCEKEGTDRCRLPGDCLAEKWGHTRAGGSEKDERVSMGEYIEDWGVESPWDHQRRGYHPKGHKGGLSCALQSFESAFLACCIKAQSPDSLQ